MILNWWFLLEIHVVWYVFFPWDPARGKNSSVGMTIVGWWSGQPSSPTKVEMFKFADHSWQSTIAFKNHRFQDFRSNISRGWNCVTPLKTNISPENWWFGRWFISFQQWFRISGSTLLLSFRAVSMLCRKSYHGNLKPSFLVVITHIFRA